jgi:hypothetical protein
VPLAVALVVAEVDELFRRDRHLPKRRRELRGVGHAADGEAPSAG